MSQTTNQKETKKKSLLLVAIKKLGIHIISGIVLLLLVWFITFQWMASYTKRGSTVTVPNLKGMTVEEAENLLNESDLVLEVHDTTFVPKKEPNEIITQEPSPERKVKKGRIVYLTINRDQPPLVQLPIGVDEGSRSNVVNTLMSKGFKLTEDKSVIHPHVGRVLKITIGEKAVKPGTKYPYGTKFTLHVASGTGSEKQAIPCVEGMTLFEAEINIKQMGFNIDTVFHESVIGLEDRTEAVVYNQQPQCGMPSFVGSFITIGLMSKESYEAWSEMEDAEPAETRAIDIPIEKPQ